MMKRQHVSYVRIDNGKVSDEVYPWLDRYQCDVCSFNKIMAQVNHGWILCDAHLPIAELYRAERALRGLA